MQDALKTVKREHSEKATKNSDTLGNILDLSFGLVVIDIRKFTHFLGRVKVKIHSFTSSIHAINPCRYFTEAPLKRIA